MRVVFTATALRQVDEVLAYIEERSPKGADNVKARLQRSFFLLGEHPFIGIETSRPGVRRVLVQPYPYDIFYRVTGGRVIVQRIRHTSRWPVGS